MNISSSTSEQQQQTQIPIPYKILFSITSQNQHQCILVSISILIICFYSYIVIFQDQLGMNHHLKSTKHHHRLFEAVDIASLQYKNQTNQEKNEELMEVMYNSSSAGYQKPHTKSHSNSIWQYNTQPQKTEEFHTDKLNKTELSFIRAMCIEARIASISTSIKSNLYDITTIQGKAFHWILNEDTRELSADASNLIQRYVLAVLFYATHGEHWFLQKGSYWLSSLHECHWQHKSSSLSTISGVTKCSQDLNVLEIELIECNLVGSLPLELGWLIHLERLDLGYNKLSGTVPSEFSNLENLFELKLNMNQLTGTVPSDLGYLKKLETLQLEGNDLTGTISNKICHLPTLEYFLTDCLFNSEVEQELTATISCTCCSMCCDSFGFCVSTAAIGSENSMLSGSGRVAWNNDDFFNFQQDQEQALEEDVLTFTDDFVWYNDLD